MRKCILLCLILCLSLELQDGYPVLRKDGEVKYIFPYKADIYTEADQNLLHKGIPLPEKDDLASTLEDYFS